MSWKYYNPNPRSNLVGDCVIRALSLALDQDWDSTYLGVTEEERMSYLDMADRLSM